MMWFKRVNKRNLISNILVIAALFAFSILTSEHKTIPGIINLIFIYSIAALALNLVCGCLGEFVLGHGGFLLAGYTATVVIVRKFSSFFKGSDFRSIFYTTRHDVLYPAGYGLIVAVVLIAALITGVIGLIVGLIALGRLKGDYLAIVTLGINLIFVNICTNFEPLGGGSGKSITTLVSSKPIINAAFLVAVIVLILAFMKSRFGRNILACRDDNIAAEACGVPVTKTKVIAFTFASVIAGIAGALLAFSTPQMPNQFNQDMSILFLIIIVLGGLGSLTGSVIASCLIVLYQKWFCVQSWVPTFFATNPKIVYGAILVLIMLFRTSGILGNSEFTWNWFYKKLKKLFDFIKDNIKSKKKNNQVKEDSHGSNSTEN